MIIYSFFQGRGGGWLAGMMVGGVVGTGGEEETLDYELESRV